MKDRLLVVEDDLAIAEPLVRALRREVTGVDHVTSGEAALDRMVTVTYDLVVLDIGLPGIDGVEVCRLIRERHGRVAVLMLTARSTELDEVIGLDAGADDYVHKPFSLAVLMARVRALLRRDAGRDTARDGDRAVSEVSGVRVDRASHRAWRDDRELELSPKQFDLLAFLVEHAGDAVRREDIMERVWDANWWGSTKTLDVHVGWLRQKLGEPALISTVRGHGYRLERS